MTHIHQRDNRNLIGKNFTYDSLTHYNDLSIKVGLFILQYYTQNTIHGSPKVGNSINNYDFYHIVCKYFLGEIFITDHHLIWIQFGY